MMYLLYFEYFSFSAACVERLFLKMKLIKTCLRSKLGQVKLEQFLCIGRELLEEGFDDSIYKYFVDKWKKRPRNQN